MTENRTFDIPPAGELVRDVAGKSPFYNVHNDEIQRKANTGALSIEQVRHAANALKGKK